MLMASVLFITAHEDLEVRFERVNFGNGRIKHLRRQTISDDL